MFIFYKATNLFAVNPLLFTFRPELIIANIFLKSKYCFIKKSHKRIEILIDLS